MIGSRSPASAGSLHLGPRSPQRGFTLIELMVVIVIVAILSTVLFGVGSRTQGGNAANVADQTVSALNFARMRSVSTRRMHRMEITPTELRLWAASATGFSATPTFNQFVQRFTIPHGVVIWDAETDIRSGSGNAVTKNDALSHSMDFKPDGTSTGGTLYIGDSQGTKNHRVLVYRATGSSYARKTW